MNRIYFTFTRAIVLTVLFTLSASNVWAQNNPHRNPREPFATGRVHVIPMPSHHSYNDSLNAATQLMVRVQLASADSVQRVNVQVMDKNSNALVAASEVPLERRNGQMVMLLFNNPYPLRNGHLSVPVEIGAVPYQNVQVKVTVIGTDGTSTELPVF